MTRIYQGFKRLLPIACAVMFFSHPLQAQTAKVKAVIDKGIEAFKAGKYAEARKSFEKAFKEYPSLNLAFNIARCFEEEGQYQKAITKYKEYLNMKPSPEGAADAKARIQILKSRMEYAQKQVTPAKKIKVVRPYKTYGYITAGVAGAAAVTALTLGILARKGYSDLDGAKPGNDGLVHSMTQSEAADRLHSADTKKLASYVMWGVAGAAAATSVVLFILKRPAKVHAFVMPESDGVGVGFFHEF